MGLRFLRPPESRVTFFRVLATEGVLAELVAIYARSLLDYWFLSNGVLTFLTGQRLRVL